MTKAEKIEKERNEMEKLYEKFKDGKVPLSQVKGLCMISNENHKKDVLLYKMKHNLG